MASAATLIEAESYQQCALSLMDTTSDPNIRFDSEGVSNYFYEYQEAESQFVSSGEAGKRRLKEDFNRIKADKGRNRYDCILGLSGGVDSTYLCLLAKEYGLNPLVVHCDNGWNAELAQHNIEQTIKRLGFDLFTYVINWEEFRELQLSYLRASVVDIEVLTDHAFMAVLYQQARQWKIRHVLTGMNVVTEQVLPRHWIYNKSDVVNISDIQSKFGTVPFRDLKTFPVLDMKNCLYLNLILKKKVHSPLNHIDYVYDDVKKAIQEELGWRDYGGKHYESVWTRFYQGYILPTKFGIDKRKAHLSTRVFSGQLTKEEAERLLAEPIYPPSLLEQDKEFVVKKFGLTMEEFDDLMKEPRREHAEFAVSPGEIWSYYPVLAPFKSAWRWAKSKLKKLS